MTWSIARPIAKRASAAGAALLAVGLVFSACSAAAPAPSAPAATAAARYAPQQRAFTVSVVPLAVHEEQDTLDYLKADFAKGGVLDGKEVYGMSPSSLTVYEGDTVTIHWVNPADDEHPIVISGGLASFTLKGQSTIDVKLTAAKPGLYTIQCVLPEHAPFMNGQLVVLPASFAPLP